MLNFKAIAVAAALTLSTAGFAMAEQSAMDALTSASTVSFRSVSEAELAGLKGGAMQQAEDVDLVSLKARIQNSASLLGQLESYGATLDDVVGISGSDETDVTILVRG